MTLSDWRSSLRLHRLKQKTPGGTDVAKRHRGKRRSKKSATWKVSEPVGGKFLNNEPVFSADEKYLFVANETAVHIYSTATSLLVRALVIGGTTVVTGYALSPTKPNTLYVSTLSGLIYHWDWVEGEKLGRWEIGSDIFGLAVAPMPSQPHQDIVYTVDKKQKWMLTAHKLMSGIEASKTELATLYRSTNPITSLRIVQGGRVIVATSGDRLLVGFSEAFQSPSLQELSYVFREISSSEWITCIDIRESSGERQSGGKKAKSQQGNRAPSVDIVVGGLQGAIFVHEDLLNKMIQMERPSTGRETFKITPRKLHWHREAVNTVKFSLDGNYIISGGSETVLVLWQVDTGKRQFLPHLASVIETLVVSPSGTSYAVRLADNSVMILSTSELKPTANIAGIQARSITAQLIPRGKITTVESLEAAASSTETGMEFPRIPSCISRVNPTQVLVAVPASQSNVQGANVNAPYLQTFDFTAAQHVSRQALARTNTTNLNIGPDANKIGEPDVKFVQVSSDGQWLATIDEWAPPRKDVEHLAVDGPDASEEQTRRREVFLKFWKWNVETKDWELVTRVDAPHECPVSGVSTGRVYGLQADPSSPGFATIGEDGAVRIWKPKTRLRNGITVRGSNAEGLTTWGCVHTVALDRFSQTDSADPAQENTPIRRACLAYSADGSTLAACIQESAETDSGVVHFINPATGGVPYIKSGLYQGVISAIGFVGRYLVTVSDLVLVWDVVEDRASFSFAPPISTFTETQRASMLHLAIDTSSETFAVAIPSADSTKRLHQLQKAHSQVAIFDPANSSPIFTTSMPRIVTSLLPTIGSKGYLTIDASAQIRVLTPRSIPAVSIFRPDPERRETLSGLENIYGDADKEDETVAATTSTAMDKRANESDEEEDDDEDAGQDDAQFAATHHIEEDNDDNDEDDAPVVRQEQLTQIFDVGPSFALPPVSELFQQVVSLFSRKPRNA
ncbi:WD40 repeat-like protein [Xylona heveae TC161]|uniref:WD40 repeat-like protein n=1 Tax=Xylona heveae (strain CBS 132557 / TC161) TaxID=1328760 RepID=A0A165GAW0_XYLHT|nr:WD40 repeat-like protein [Xylona heveae TC161]KZF21962.1 WD40 repeat-like protein [Xylona heveae TC161]